MIYTHPNTEPNHPSPSIFLSDACCEMPPGKDCMLGSNCEAYARDDKSKGSSKYSS